MYIQIRTTPASQRFFLYISTYQFFKIFCWRGKDMTERLFSMNLEVCLQPFDLIDDLFSFFP